ncbi:ABC transporter ATP-binding protein [Streptomyces abyssalis]|uniref:ABC transporter ATP-binding protein n=1 Tax=Streptomyces abyssalis TaxID=933944 RepID=UPI00099F76AF
MQSGKGLRMISFEAVSKHYPNGTTAVDDLTLELPEGGLTVLVGSSGCGKTTTLRMINRMVDPSAGTVRVAGRDVRDSDAAELRRSIGYVIQQSGLFPHRTVLDNIATVPLLLGWGRRKARSRAAELLERVGLEAESGDRYPHQLSGGQQQRVGVARALAADPPVLLMDEPFGAVDPVVRTQLQDELLRLQRDLRKTVVFVTHDIDEAVRLGDRIAVFRTGGRLVQCAPPARLLTRPADDFVAGFLGAERGLKLLSLTTLGEAEVPHEPVTPVRTDEPVAEIRVGGNGGSYEGTQGNWRVAVTPDGAPVGWLDAGALPAGGTAGDAGLLPLRPLRDEDSLLAALDESVSSPARAVARVDGDGVLSGVTGQAALHERAAVHHTAAATAEPAEPGGEPGAGGGRSGQEVTGTGAVRTAEATS